MAQTGEVKTPFLHIDGVIYGEAGEFVAHALQLDLVVTAPTEEQAVDDLLDVCVAQIKYAFENDNFEYLFRPAPAKIWRKWQEAEGGFERSVEISLGAKAKRKGRAPSLSFSYAKAA